MSACVRACVPACKQKFVLTEFWFFALQWAMCSSLVKLHNKEFIIVIITHACRREPR